MTTFFLAVFITYNLHFIIVFLLVLPMYII